MRTAVGAEEAEPSRPEDLAGRVAGDAGTTDAQRGLRLAELILSESRRAGQGPGSRLPTERRLALDLGVTRSSVRHALALLEAQGRISREVGRGTFLREPAPGGPGGEAPSRPPAGGGDFAPAHVMMVRRLLEP